MKRVLNQTTEVVFILTVMLLTAALIPGSAQAAHQANGSKHYRRICIRRNNRYNRVLPACPPVIESYLESNHKENLHGSS